MKRFFYGATVAAFLVASPAVATNSPIELKTALADLMAGLANQFDSEPQRYFEEESKMPKELRHTRVYRSFTRIDAPDVGANVLVADVRYGGKDGRFDNGEFQVWTLNVDEARHAVKMTPWRFKEPEKYKNVYRDATKLKGLSASALLPGEGAPGCVIWWRKLGDQLSGRTEPGVCTSKNAKTGDMTTWTWEYALTQTELWVSFEGRDPTGKVTMGSPGDTFWRLGKARTFECFLSYRPKKGEPQVNNGFQMHDRGDVYRWQVTEGKKVTPVFAFLLRGMWPSNSGRNYKDLLRLDVYAGKPEDPKEKWEYLGGGFASAESDRAGFTTPNISGRCKVFDPSAPPPKN